MPRRHESVAIMTVIGFVLVALYILARVIMMIARSATAPRS